MTADPSPVRAALETYITAVDTDATTAAASLADAAARLSTALATIADLVSPSGKAVPQGDLPGWRQVLAEDFLTDCGPGALTTTYPRMEQYPPVGQEGKYHDTSGRGIYNRINHRVSRSVCYQHLHTMIGVPSVAALIPLLDPAGGKWGDMLGSRVAVRARCPHPLPGFKIAWLRWPKSDQSKIDGEIDFPEGPLDGGPLSGFLHHAPATPDPPQEQYKLAFALDATWRTFASELVAGQYVSFLVDDVEVFRSTTRVPAQPMHWVLQSETLLGSAPVPASTDGEIEIDWVAAWAVAS